MEIKLGKFYLFVILAYLSQGLLYTSGSIISKMLMLLWLLIGLIYMFRVFFTIKTSKIDIMIFLFTLMQVFYWLFSPGVVGFDDSYTPSHLVLKDILVVQLSYFPFRYFICKKYLGKSEIKLFIFLLFFIYIFQFFRHQTELLLLTNSDFVTNNDSYNFVALISLFALFFNNKKIYYPCIAIMLSLILLGAKRGAIICVLFVLLVQCVYLIKYNKCIQKSSNFIFILFLIVLTVVSLYFFQNYDYLQQRIIDTANNNSSDRDIIYRSLYEYCISRTSFMQFMFGSGFMATENIVGTAAHQDWLELWTNNGAIGVLLYMLFFLTLLNFYRKSKNYMTYIDKAMFIGSCAFWLIKSMFSMGYYSPCISLSMLSISYVQHNVMNAKLMLK